MEVGNIKLRVDIKGNYALFTRPEMKVERVSYDCITPSAVRGLLKAIYWHKGMEYEIDKIYILNPIQFINIRRNEVKSKIPFQKVLRVANKGEGELYISSQTNITQRASVILKNVHYVVDAHISIDPKKINKNDNEKKFAGIFNRRLKKGQCFHTPYLGCREFPAIVSLYDNKDIKTAYSGKQDLGFMLYEMIYKTDEIVPSFFRAVLNDGVLDLTNQEVFM